MVALPPPDVLTRSLRDLIAAGRFRDAFELHQLSDNPSASLRPEAQLLAATAATRVGELKAAQVLATGAFERYRLKADADGRMRAVNLLGAIKFENGLLEDAERCFSDALSLARQLDDSLLVAHASNNLASVAHLRDAPDEALSLYRSALLSYQRLGDRQGAAQTYHNFGLAFRQIGQWQEAENSAAQAVRHAELAGEASVMALAVMGRIELNLARGELDIAAQDVERASKLTAESHDQIGGAEVRRLRALLALKQQDYETASKEAEAARAVAQLFSSALLQADCAGVCALALRGLGLHERAAERRDEAVTGWQRLGAQTLLDRFEEDWSQLLPS